ncbi:MAG: hypothetical protein VW080_04645 [Flavobacteriaceae bacterium]
MKLNNREVSNKMRIYHRYLGFYLAGVMAVYAFSGTIMIFRRTDTFKKVTEIRSTTGFLYLRQKPQHKEP